MENQPVEVISHRERRRRLFAKGSADRKSETPMRMEETEEGRALGTEDQEKADRKMTRLDESSWMTVNQFRCQWNKLWSGSYGSFEDTSEFSMALVRFSLNNFATDNSRILADFAIPFILHGFGFDIYLPTAFLQ